MFILHLQRHIFGNQYLKNKKWYFSFVFVYFFYLIILIKKIWGDLKGVTSSKCLVLPDSYKIWFLSEKRCMLKVFFLLILSRPHNFYLIIKCWIIFVTCFWYIFFFSGGGSLRGMSTQLHGQIYIFLFSFIISVLMHFLFRSRKGARIAGTLVVRRRWRTW